MFAVNIDIRCNDPQTGSWPPGIELKMIVRSRPNKFCSAKNKQSTIARQSTQKLELQSATSRPPIDWRTKKDQ